MTGTEIYKQKLIEKTTSKIDNEYVRGYYNYIINNTTEATAYQYITYVNKFLKETNKAVEELSFINYNNYIASLNGKSSSYKIAVYSAIKKFSEFLYASETSKKNYMLDVPRPKAVQSQKTKEKREKGFLATNEIDEYLFSVKTGVGNGRARARQENWKERDLAIISIFLITGMRCSALYKLDVNSIDFDKHVINTVDKGEKIIDYAMTPKLEDIIKEWLDVRNDIVNEDEPALFVSNRLKRISNEGIACIVNKYAVNIKGKHITPHKLRATFGTQIQEKYHDIYFTQKVMHHSSPVTTELYVRGQNNNGIKAAEVMSDFI